MKLKKILNLHIANEFSPFNKHHTRKCIFAVNKSFNDLMNFRSI